MKNVKKLLVWALALVMCVSVMGVSAFAASNNDGKITIDNAVNGETYTLYKVFDLTYGGDGSTAEGTTSNDATAGTYSPVSYTYTSVESDAFLTALQNSQLFTVTLIPGTTNQYSVVKVDTATDEAIITFMQNNINSLPESKKSEDKTASDDKAEWTGLGYGYYYITSSVGSFVTIDSTLKEVTVKEKNTIPTLDLKQATDTNATLSAGSSYGTEQLNVQVGDTVFYEIEVTDGKGTDNEITIAETLTNGLTNKKDYEVYVLKSGEDQSETEVTAGNDTYAISDESDTAFKAKFAKAYVKGLAEGDKIYIRFSATVNTAAATDTDAEKETGKSVLTYSVQTDEEELAVVTYKFQLDKSDKDYADLLGAKFQLYRSSVEGTQIKFAQGTTEDSIPVLYVDPNGSIDTIDLSASGQNSAKVIIKGLKNETYVLRETEAPAGYNAAADTNVESTAMVLINGTITDTANAIEGDTGVITVVNLTGTELPSTGGIGTTIFYIVGGALVVGAGVLLVTKRRVGFDK